MTVTAAQDAGDLLNTRQVADFLGLNPGTLGHWACRNHGPEFHYVGRQRRYWAKDVYSWVSAQPGGGENAHQGGSE